MSVIQQMGYPSLVDSLYWAVPHGTNGVLFRSPIQRLGPFRKPLGLGILQCSKIRVDFFQAFAYIRQPISGLRFQ